jgi:hypothetical protein
MDRPTAAAAFENKAGRYELIRVEDDHVYYSFTNRKGKTVKCHGASDHVVTDAGTGCAGLKTHHLPPASAFFAGKSGLSFA